MISPMTSRRSLLLILLAATAVPLAGCSTVKDELGLTRRTPDEFAVVTRAPLEIPPSLSGPLPRPQPGAQRPQEISPGMSAQAAILSQPVPTADSQSGAEAALLQRAGATGTDPNIRAVVNKESAEGAEDNRPVVKKILNLGNKKDDGPASIVDAPAEIQRIQSNKKAGQPLTYGDTPTLDD